MRCVDGKKNEVKIENCISKLVMKGQFDQNNQKNIQKNKKKLDDAVTL